MIYAHRTHCCYSTKLDTRFPKKWSKSNQTPRWSQRPCRCSLILRHQHFVPGSVLLAARLPLTLEPMTETNSETKLKENPGKETLLLLSLLFLLILLLLYCYYYYYYYYYYCYHYCYYYHWLVLRTPTNTTKKTSNEYI